MSYKQIHETFWTDPQAKKYKPLHRYLFGYFISGPHAHYSGLYYLPIVYIQNDTGLAPKEIKEGIAFLSSQGHIFYDDDREIIFVKSELVYQWDSKDLDGKPKMNPKQVAGIKKHFDTLHKSPLIAKFLEIYAYLNIDYTGMDRGINTGMDRAFVPVPVPVPVPEGVQEGGAGGNEPEELTEIIDHLNLRTRKSYKTSSRKTSDLIKARMNEGFTVDDFKRVIDNQTVKWLNDPKMCEYLRPETLFGTKFESYLNATPNLSQANLVSESSAGILGWAERKMQMEEGNGKL